MRSASSWKNVLVVRPQPGHAVTIGVNERRPIVCRISCATMTSLRAVAVRLGRERDADRVADAFLQQHGHRGGRGDDALRAHARLGEAEVQRVVAARARARGRPRSGPAPPRPCTTARCDRPAGPSASACARALERGDDQRLAHHGVGLERRGRASRSRPSGARAAPGRGCPSSRRCAPACRSGDRLLDHRRRTARRACVPWPTLPGLMRYLRAPRRTPVPARGACGR